MINVKDIVYKELSQKNKNVSDAYPHSFDIELIFGIIKAHHKLRVM